MAQLRILIAEDNNDIAENIGDFLEFKGHQIDFAMDGVIAAELAAVNKYDVILMDIMMPRLNGLKATAKIRESEHADIPIIMLTAKDTVDEKIEGLNSGADDYLVKPFAMEELYARIKAQVRKSSKSYNDRLQLYGIILNDLDESVTISNEVLFLKPTPYKILKLLSKNYPQLVDKPDIEFYLWGTSQPDKDILRSHIYNLRQSLDKFSDFAKVISKHGRGYKLVIEKEVQS